MELPIEEPPAAAATKFQKVLCFGASLTEGLTIVEDVGGLWRELYTPYSDVLVTSLGPRGLAVENCGRSGDRAANMRERLSGLLETPVSSAGSSDGGSSDGGHSVVVILAGTNDLSDGLSGTEVADAVIELHHTALASNGEGILSTAATVAVTIPALGPQCDEASPDSDYEQRRQSANAALRVWVSSADAAGRVLLVDIDAHFDSARVDSTTKWCPDGVHFSAAGYALLGKLVLEAIRPLLARHVFISCSALSREWRTVPAGVLESALFFFGSKRSWLFPSIAAERSEAMRQPGKYHAMDRDFLELIRAKERRGEVYFLKKPSLVYSHYPGPEDPQAFGRASEWLVRNGGQPLQLDERWWKEKGERWPGFKYVTQPYAVVANYRAGYHEYDEVQELLHQSDPGYLLPVHYWQ